jgi:N6-L-threonylcarbamoyladenine synthase
MIALAAALRWHTGCARPTRDRAFDVRPRWPLDAIDATAPPYA